MRRCLSGGSNSGNFGVGYGRRRVVVTGMGVVSPLGTTLGESWNRIIGSSNGINGDDVGAIGLEETLRHHQDLDADQFDREWKIGRSLPCQVAAPVRGLMEACTTNGIEWNPRTNPRFVQLALLAGSEALKQANLDGVIHNHKDGTEEDGQSDCPHLEDRFGVCVGSGMSAVREIRNAWDLVGSGSGSGSIRRLSPQFIPRVLTNSAAGRLALEFGLKGPNLAPSTACAASAHAIGDAVTAIKMGAADLMLAGGAEASIEPLGLAGFCRLRALSTSFNETPFRASRPFDARRDGFVMGEGAALLVLEELEHARARISRHRKNHGDSGSVPRILAEVTGYAATGDAFHVTAPDEAGRGAEKAMLLALEEDTRTEEAFLSSSSSSSSSLGERPFPPAIGYVNAHATSTPKGDRIEADVVDRVLRCHNKRRNNENENATDVLSGCYLSSTKGMSGHLLGAAGALEAAFTVMSLVDQTIPPTWNLEDDGSGVRSSDGPPPLYRHVHGDRGIQPESELELAVSNSFGFGGTNASLVFRKYRGDDSN